METRMFIEGGQVAAPPPPPLGEDKLRGGGGVSDSQSVVMMNLLSDRQHGLTENARANTAHRLSAA